MNRTSLVIALIVPSLLGACGAGENTVGTEWPDAGNAQDTSNASDSCTTGCTSGAAKLVLSAPEACLSAPVGQRSGSQTFDISNEGTGSSGALNVSLSGNNAPSFEIASNTCTGATLAVGAKCSVAVAYAPTAAHANAESANLTVADAVTSVQALIRGSDIGTVTLSPAALSFGEVAAGSTSDEAFVRVTTTSYCETRWTVIVDSPNFTISSNTCTGHITGTCQIGVRFAPPADATASSFAGFLTLTASDSGTASVALTGVIAPPHPTPGPLMATPAVFDFGEVIVGQSATG
ncbi:MAG TPA: choice-of-anchor D domain-containing protein, partial [Polyangia bacterium]